MDSGRLPDVLTVEEAAQVLRISRGLAYEAARRWRATGGREGLPVVSLGRVLRVPRSALEEMLATGDARLGSRPPASPPARPAPRRATPRVAGRKGGTAGRGRVVAAGVATANGDGRSNTVGQHQLDFDTSPSSACCDRCEDCGGH